MKRLALILIYPLLVLAAAQGLLWYALAVCFGPARAWKIAVGFDQLANATWGNNEDETVSSMAAKAARKRWVWWAVALCYVLEKIDPGHCDRAIEKDIGESI